ncbi:hypothetical protein V2J09_023725 [Rumex salicifolius]
MGLHLDFDGHRNKEETAPKEMKHHKHLEGLAKTGVVLAGAYAMHEKHKAKKDPENAHKHRIREEVAATVAVGATGFAFHEHHKVKELNKEKSHARHLH